MLTITDQVNKVVAGQALGAHLRAELTAFMNGGPAGAALLNPILVGQAPFEVVIKADAPTAASGSRVTINPKETKIDVANTLPDLREFVESTIFELTNAANANVFAPLDTNLANGTIPIIDYGTQKANLEAQASWNVYQLLQQRAGYAPSAWGTAQINACSPHPNLTAFATAFRGIPHDAAAAAHTAAALPTAEYYAFNGSYIVGGTSNSLDNLFTNILHNKGGTKRLSLEKLKAQIPQSSQINKVNIRAAIFYWVTLEWLAPNASLNVTWRHPQAQCKFTQAMKDVAPDAGGQLGAALNKAVNTQLNSLLI